MKKLNILFGLLSGTVIMNRFRGPSISTKTLKPTIINPAIKSFTASEIYKNNITNVVTVINRPESETNDNEQPPGLGTGIIYRKNNGRLYILTNNHVITGGKNIQILLNSSIYDVDVIGTSSDIDLAVLKFSNYTPKEKISTKIIDKDKLIVGESAIAIGSPSGLIGTITQGIISSLDRDVSGTGMLYIQTDAAINPGNSGGPLFNDRGEVIGLNTFIVENTVGLGFAIPSSIVLKATNEIIKYGLFRKNYIGIIGEDLIENRSIKGVKVNQVLKYGPSDTILKKNDIILEFDGTKIYDMSTLRNKLVYNSLPGVEYTIKINRRDKELDISIMLESKNDIIRDLDNIVVEPVNYNIINDINKRHFKDNELKEALKVIDTGNSSLEIGDIVLEINNKRYRSIGKTLEDMEGGHSFKGILKKSSNTIKLSIYRNKEIKNIDYMKTASKSIIRGEIA